MNNLRRLLIPVIAMALICFSSFTILVVSTTNQSDKTSLDAETLLIRTNIIGVTGYLAALTETAGWWTLAYHNVVEDFDLEWIENNVDSGQDSGYMSASNIDIRGEMLVDVNNNIVYSLNNFQGIDFNDFLQNGLSDVLDTLAIDDYLTPKTVPVLQVLDDRIFVMGVSMIQRSDGLIEGKIPPEKRPVIIFISELDQMALSVLGQRTSLANLRVDTTIEDGEASVKLDNQIIDHVIGDTSNINIVWTPSAPGSELVKGILMPGLVMLILLIGSWLLFFRNASVIVKDLKAADNTKSEFLANMSHEIRTPLNAIIGFTEMLKMEIHGSLGSDKNREYIGLVERSGKSLLSLVNDILDLSKVEAGQLEIQMTPFETDKEIIHCVKTVSQQAEKKSVSISKDLSAQMLISDIKIFGQAVTNILSNAIKFTPDGGNIVIKNYVESEYFVVEVSDTGIGMDEQEIKTAFSQFGQIQSAYSRDHAGTGLGLTLVDNFMKALGGSIKVTSEKNIGTTVQLYFAVQA